MVFGKTCKMQIRSKLYWYISAWTEEVSLFYLFNVLASEIMFWIEILFLHTLNTLENLILGI